MKKERDIKYPLMDIKLMNVLLICGIILTIVNVIIDKQNYLLFATIILELFVQILNGSTIIHTIKKYIREHKERDEYLGKMYTHFAIGFITTFLALCISMICVVINMVRGFHASLFDFIITVLFILAYVLGLYVIREQLVSLADNDAKLIIGEDEE